jgi:hypothetical protein
MKIGMRCLATALALLGAPVSARACEPIVSFVKAAAGQGLLAISLVVLAVVVVFKSAAFARFQTKLSFKKALLCMLAANVFTSAIGLIVPAMIDSGGAVFIAVPLVWAVCLLPAQRLIAAAPCASLARFSPAQVAFGITLVMVASCLLLLLSRTVHDAAGFTSYWLFKVPVIYLALAIGLVLTGFWEEWIVWRLSSADEDDLSFVRPVIRANALVLVALVIISFAFLVPKRVGAFAQSDQPQASLKAKPQAAKNLPAR